MQYDRGRTEKVKGMTGKLDDDKALRRDTTKAQWGQGGQVDDIIVFRLGHESWGDWVTHSMARWGNMRGK